MTAPVQTVNWQWELRRNLTTTNSGASLSKTIINAHKDSDTTL
jgi:hypothetical protein